MSFYRNNVLPHLINCACGMKAVEKQRAKVVPQAWGNVLEIGMGSGLNLKHYEPQKIEQLWGLEPSDGMRRKARKPIAESGLTVKWLNLGSEQIPLEDNSMDTVVLTYTLCTIDDESSALSEMRRVLKPSGKLLFCEHGQAIDASVQKWQQRINPAWRRIAGGCHLNKPIEELISGAQFKIQNLEQGYIPGPKIAAYNYWGSAIL